MFLSMLTAPDKKSVWASGDTAVVVDIGVVVSGILTGSSRSAGGHIGWVMAKREADAGFQKQEAEAWVYCTSLGGDRITDGDKQPLEKDAGTGKKRSPWHLQEREGGPYLGSQGSSAWTSCRGIQESQRAGPSLQ